MEKIKVTRELIDILIELWWKSSLECKVKASKGKYFEIEQFHFYVD